MTHHTKGGSAAAVYPPFTTPPDIADLYDRPRAPPLDRHGLHVGIADRRRRIQTLEQRLVAACERAAARHAPRHVRIDDRETWDRATWDRYLAAATRLEPNYGPALQRLYRAIDQLERLAALPLAA